MVGCGKLRNRSKIDSVGHEKRLKLKNQKLKIRNMQKWTMIQILGVTHVTVTSLEKNESKVGVTNGVSGI